MQWIGEADTVTNGDPTGAGDDFRLVSKLLPDGLPG